ncbi:SCF ubiquitin ligase complex subunit cdc4 [Cryptotrichosporon argae]
MSNLSPSSLHATNESSTEYASAPTPSSSSSSWTRDGPCIRLEPAVVEKVVTHTTRTTTTFAPIALPRINPPDNIDFPVHLSTDVYPLAREPIPDDLRVFMLDLDGRRVVVQEEGAHIPPDGLPGISHGPGWVRSNRPVKKEDERMNLLQAFMAKSKEARKRPHLNKADAQTPPPSSRQNDRPRKKIRSIGDVAITDSGYMSPLPSPDHEDKPPVPATASLGSGLEVAALFSLPSVVDQFDKFPDQLQQHVLMHLLRRSRVPTVQRILSLASNALRRDFIGLLPHEIAVQILGYVDAKSLAAASLVNRKWYSMINDERSVWRDRIMADGLYYGLGTEEAEEAVIERRYEALDAQPRDKLATPQDEDESMHEEEEPLPYRPTALKHVYRRRYQNNRNWLRGQPHHISFAGHGTNVVTCLQFDEDKIVSASDDHSINVYGTRTGHLRKRLDGHEGGVWALEYKGDTLVSGSTDRTVRVWDLESLTQAHVFNGHTSTVRCLQIVEPVYDAATGEYQPPYPLIVTGSRDSTLRVWKLPKKGEEPYIPPTDSDSNLVPPEHNPYHVHLLSGHTSAVRALAAHGRYCISGSYDNDVRVWDIVKGTCVHVLTGHEQKVYSIVYDALRNRCVSGSMDNTVKIWDLATGACLQTLQGHTSLVGLLGISPNHIVSAAADASLRIWSANSHQLEHVLSSHGGAITCFQHDETKVISGSDGSLKLWDIRTGECVGDLVVGISSVWQVAFKDNLLIAASNRNNNTFFDVFDFGALDDPSGVDNEKLDKQVRPPWERDNPREPQTYQLEDDHPDSGIVSPVFEHAQRRSRHRTSRNSRSGGPSRDTTRRDQHPLLYAPAFASHAQSPTPAGSRHRMAGPSSSFVPMFDDAGEDELMEDEAELVEVDDEDDELVWQG